MIRESSGEDAAVDLGESFPRETDDIKLIDVGTRDSAQARTSSGELPSGFVFEQRSTIAGATFNFVNSIVGAGIIGAPL
jgi:hypothetical protein